MKDQDRTYAAARYPRTLEEYQEIAREREDRKIRYWDNKIMRARLRAVMAFIAILLIAVVLGAHILWAIGMGTASAIVAGAMTVLFN